MAFVPNNNRAVFSPVKTWQNGLITAKLGLYAAQH